MDASTVASQSSDMTYIYLLTLIVFLLILIFIYIYFTSKFQKQEASYEKKSQENEQKLADITEDVHQLTKQIKNHGNHTTDILENELSSLIPDPIELLDKQENHTTDVLENESSSLLPDLIAPLEPLDKEDNVPKLPSTRKEPFESTEGITTDDFIIFKGLRLLIVEDNLINQKILLNVLKKSGMNITVANNGREALDLLIIQREMFDLILMDISMPIMDGYDATQSIREDEHFDYIPIVTFTAFVMGKEIEKMFDLGSNAYITKPLNIGELYTVFDTYLDKKEREISLLETIKTEGLDIKHGIALTDNNEEQYKQTLREFVVLYSSLADSIPKWIDEEEYDRIKFACIQMADILKPIGAYDLANIVFKMKKIFVYNTEHRIEEYREIFPEKLSRLVNAINRYLAS